jgi:hypothetical protein
MQLTAFASILIPCFALYWAANLCGLTGLPAASFGAIAGDLIDWLVARSSQSLDSGWWWTGPPEDVLQARASVARCAVAATRTVTFKDRD